MCPPVKNICSSVAPLPLTRDPVAPVRADRPPGRPVLLPSLAFAVMVFCCSVQEQSGFPSFFRAFGSGCQPGLVGAHEHGRALVIGPALPARPGAGTLAGPGARMAWKRPQARTPGKSRPARGAAFLQHDLYSPSALGLDVPPPRHLGARGSRGDSLHGLVHTSPLGHLGASRRGHGSHIPDMCTRSRRPSAEPPAAKRSRYLVQAGNGFRVLCTYQTRGRPPGLTHHAERLAPVLCTIRVPRKRLRRQSAKCTTFREISSKNG